MIRNEGYLELLKIKKEFINSKIRELEGELREIDGEIFIVEACSKFIGNRQNNE